MSMARRSRRKRRPWRLEMGSPLPRHSPRPRHKNIHQKSPFRSNLPSQRSYPLPFPKSSINLFVLARRTAECPVGIAWQAVVTAKRPQDIAATKELHTARALIAQKVEQHTHTPPKFSKDGRFALLTISCSDQIHPVIATRWSTHPPQLY